MAGIRLLFVLVLLLPSSRCSPDVIIPIENKSSIMNSVKNITFSVIGSKNETGHWISTFKVDAIPQKIRSRWKVDVTNQVSTLGEMELFHLEGRLTVAPPSPEDYEFFPGIAYYKLHSKDERKIQDAYKECSKEGGHLGIVNSELEANVFKSLLNRYNVQAAFIEFHDRITEGEYVTIYGEPLKDAGFEKWFPGQPDNYEGKEDCGCFRREGSLNDYDCDKPFPFLCEYDLAWVS